MKHNHIEEILLIIAAHAFMIYNVRYVHAYGFSKLTIIIDFLKEGEFYRDLLYLTPFLFYVLAAVIFFRKRHAKIQEEK